MDDRLRGHLHANQGLIAAAALDYPAGTCIDAHVHTTHQLVYAVEGVMRVQAAPGTWVVPPARALWIPAGIEHRISCGGVMRMRTLYIDPSFERPSLREPSVVAITPLMRELILRLVEMQIGDATREDEACVVALILNDLVRVEVEPLHVPLPQNGRLREICAAIAADPGSTWGAREWGRRFSVSAKTLEREFRQVLGMPLGQWRRHVRLLAALERLASGESATDVALSLGYASPSAFTAMFRRALGSPPSSFAPRETSQQ